VTKIILLKAAFSFHLVIRILVAGKFAHLCQVSYVTNTHMCERCFNHSSVRTGALVQYFHTRACSLLMNCIGSESNVSLRGAHNNAIHTNDDVSLVPRQSGRAASRYAGTSRLHAH